MSRLAFQANYADLKVIKTRKCVQIIFELPTEQFDAAYEVLGGLPNPAAERWFAIAALKPETEVMQAARLISRPVDSRSPSQHETKGAKRDWRNLKPSQQAGIRCNEPAFTSFLIENRKDEWRDCYVEAASDGANAAECVRMICGVNSRVELETNQKARVIWHQLNDQYEAWLKVGA